jgi:tetratricopeptide (TPR) repeat protein
MGDIYRELDKPVQALRCYEEQLELANELHRRYPESFDFNRDRALGNERMGDLHLLMGQPEMAHGFYEDQLKIAKDLHQGYPDSADFSRDLEVSCNKMGRLLFLTGLPAAGFFRNALDIAEELHRRHPQSSEYDHDLVACYCNMAENAEKASNDDPRRWWRMADDLLCDMRRRGVLRPADERQIEIVKDKLL